MAEATLIEGLRELRRPAVRCWWGGMGFSQSTAEERARQAEKGGYVVEAYHAYCETPDDSGKFWVRVIPGSVEVVQRGKYPDDWGISFLGVPQVWTETVDGITRVDDPRWVEEVPDA
jgi:hypothetical protein